MDSDPPPRSPQLSQRRGSVEAFPSQPVSDDRWAGRRMLEHGSIQQPGPCEAKASPAVQSVDADDLPPGVGGAQPEASPGPASADPGLGLASPLIGALIGLLTLVVPLFAVLDDRPGHPLVTQPLSGHVPAQGSGAGPARSPQELPSWPGFP